MALEFLNPATKPSTRGPTPTPGPLPRVLYALSLDPGRKFGSMEEQLVLLADAFQREGGLFLPLFITDPKSAVLDDFVKRGVQAECLNLRRFSLATLFALRRLVRRERIDVIHWNFIEPLANPYVWALSLLCPKLRHWFTDHNSRVLPIRPPTRGFERTLKGLFLRRYDKVVCVSEYVRQCLEDQGGWSNLVAVTHFINTARFVPDESVRAETRHDLGADDQLVMLVVGQLIPEKGIAVALEAMKLLPPTTSLWVIGAGAMEAELRQRIAALQLGDRVRMLGLRSNVQTYLQAADLLVCPSTWAEAAGLVNLEAQACGIPVVASRIGGIVEYVADGRTGLLFEPGHAEDLARQVTRLTDPEVRGHMAKEARAWALAQFSPEARLPELLDLYRKGG